MGTMFWLAYEYRMKGEAKIKWAAVVVAFIALGSAIISLSMDYWVPQFQYEEFRRRHMRTQRVAFEALGRKVGEMHDGGRVVVVEYDDTAYSDMQPEEDRQEEVITTFDAFEKGLGGKVTVEKRIKVLADTEAMYMEGPIPAGKRANFYTVELLNAVLDKYQDCDVIALFVGLPLDHEVKFKLWKIQDEKKRPSLVLLNTQPGTMKKAMKRGYVSLMMIEKPQKVDFEEPLPESDQELFESRYLLITEENLDRAEAEFPKIFSY